MTEHIYVVGHYDDGGAAGYFRSKKDAERALTEAGLRLRKSGKHAGLWAKRGGVYGYDIEEHEIGFLHDV